MDFSGSDLECLPVSELNLERTTSRFSEILDLKDPEKDLNNDSASMDSISSLSPNLSFLSDTETNSDYFGFSPNPPPPSPSLEEEGKNGLAQNNYRLSSPFFLDFPSLQNYAEEQQQKKQQRQQKSNSSGPKEEQVQKEKEIPKLVINQSPDQSIGGVKKFN